MGSGGDTGDADGAADAWRAWEPADDDALPDEPRAPAEVIFDPTPAASPTAEDDAAFAGLLRSLRAVPGPCAPPVGEGSFDILYASVREIVVWYSPAKDGVEQREVAIPSRLARAGWATLRRGEPVDEAALRAVAAGAAGGRWLLALFAQVPAVEIQTAPASDGQDAGAITLRWRGGAGAS